MKTTEQTVNGHNVKVVENGRHTLVYVDDKLVKTNFTDTIATLERLETPEFEDDVTAMNRVVSAVFGRAP